MLVAKIVVKNIKDYDIISKLTEYSYDDTVIVDIYDRCQVSVPKMFFSKCLNMLYSHNLTFDIIDYIDTTED